MVGHLAKLALNIQVTGSIFAVRFVTQTMISTRSAMELHPSLAKLV